MMKEEIKQVKESGLKLASDALRGDDMNKYLLKEVLKAKRKTAYRIENVADKKQRKTQPKSKSNPKTKVKCRKIIVNSTQDYIVKMIVKGKPKVKCGKVKVKSRQDYFDQ